MKKTFLLIFVAIAILSFIAGCSRDNTVTETNLPLGVYQFQESDEPVKPNVVLDDNNQFVFNIFCVEQLSANWNVSNRSGIS